MASPTYATSTDLQRAAGGATRLLELTDFDDDGSEDTDLVADTLCQAEGLVDSYVRKVHTTPLVAPIPQSITTITANIAIWMLKGYRDAHTESDIERHLLRVKWLEGVAKGSIDLGATPTTAASPLNKASSTARPSSKAVSRENMKGYA